MSDEQFRAMLEIHTVVPFKMLRAASPYLRDAGKADREAGREVFRKVVNVTSISGTQGNFGQANYSAAKAGLVGLTKTLAREWGAFKVNVNAVAFGFVETRMTADLPQQMRDAAPQIIPLGRPAQPEEAAGAIFFLCSPWSNFVHGQVITASGGQTTGMTSCSFDLDAIGRPGAAHTLRRHGGGARAVRGRNRRRAGRPGLRDRARVGDDRSCVALGGVATEARKRVVHYEHDMLSTARSRPA